MQVSVHCNGSPNISITSMKAATLILGHLTSTVDAIIKYMFISVISQFRNFEIGQV